MSYLLTHSFPFLIFDENIFSKKCKIVSFKNKQKKIFSTNSVYFLIVLLLITSKASTRSDLEYNQQHNLHLCFILCQSISRDIFSIIFATEGAQFSLNCGKLNNFLVHVSMKFKRKLAFVDEPSVSFSFSWSIFFFFLSENR